MQGNTYLSQRARRIKNLRKAVTGVAIVASLSACTTVELIPLSQEVSTDLAGKKVVVTKYSTPNFMPLTPESMAFAVVGVVAAMSQGHEIVESNGLEDPALMISQRLAEKLSEERSVTLISNHNVIAESDDVSTLTSIYPGADYLLDVKTFAWAFNYYPTDWAHYRIMYNARLRLIDSSTKKVIAEALCKSPQGDDKNPPSKDQLLNNKASLLKAYLGQAASGCINLFSKDILKLSAEKNAVGIEAALPSGRIPQPSPPSSTVQPPLMQGSQAVSSGLIPGTGESGNAEKWSGLMSCDARQDNNARGAYQAKFAMEVNGSSVYVHRQLPQVAETLSGQVANNALVLLGEGYLTDTPNLKWQFRISGDFQPGAPIYSGKGNMLSNGHAIRACELIMKRITLTQNR